MLGEELENLTLQRPIGGAEPWEWSICRTVSSLCCSAESAEGIAHFCSFPSSPEWPRSWRRISRHIMWCATMRGFSRTLQRLWICPRDSRSRQEGQLGESSLPHWWRRARLGNWKATDCMIRFLVSPAMTSQTGTHPEDLCCCEGVGEKNLRLHRSGRGIR